MNPSTEKVQYLLKTSANSDLYRQFKIEMLILVDRYVETSILSIANEIPIC